MSANGSDSQIALDSEPMPEPEPEGLVAEPEPEPEGLTTEVKPQWYYSMVSRGRAG